MNSGDRNMTKSLVHSRKMILGRRKGSPWAEEMVLNPGLIQDPRTGRLHLLFRATGPWATKQISGKPLPYPIFLGYSCSDDQGATWQTDFSRPALAPALSYEKEGIYIRNCDNEKVVNYANGCIEDPRLFFLEGQCYMIAACRLMPPGPFWLNDEPMQCAPDWTRGQQPFGKAASANVTVNVLYKVDLVKLARNEYDAAFQYVIHLTDPELDENRDVVLFPEKMRIQGRMQYVCLHRPFYAEMYPFVKEKLLPSIFICATDNLKKLSSEMKSQQVLASPLFSWESDRIGASTPPLRISPTEWLLNYHGRTEEQGIGYTQSFMILEAQPDAFPRIAHRCPDRILYATEPWEMPLTSPRPAIFVTGMIKLGDRLMLAYGASDERVGTALIDYAPLLAHVRQFDAQGRSFKE